MDKYHCECLYCGHAFEAPYHWFPGSLGLSCPKCSDKNIRVKKVDESSRNVFAYEEPKKEEEEVPFEWSNPHDYD